MSESINWATSPEQLHQPLTLEELRVIGDEVINASQLIDFKRVVDQHVAATGVENPNSVRPGLFVGKPEVGVPLSGDNAYRSIDRRALEDLAATGVVRGSFTATDGERANTKSHTAYWSLGKEGSTHGFATPGHAILEVPREHAESGWVTAD